MLFPDGSYNRSQLKRAMRQQKKATEWAALEAQFGRPLRPRSPFIVASYPRGYGRDPGYYANGGLRGVKYSNRNWRGSGYVMNALKKLTTSGASNAR